MISAHKQAVLRIVDAMNDSKVVHGDPDQVLQYAEIAVEALAAWKYQDDQEGWLFSRGRVLVLLETDADGDDDGNSYGTWIARAEEDEQ